MNNLMVQALLWMSQAQAQDTTPTTDTTAVPLPNAWGDTTWFWLLLLAVLVVLAIMVPQYMKRSRTNVRPTGRV
jgi:hypothetical protein